MINNYFFFYIQSFIYRNTLRLSDSNSYCEKSGLNIKVKIHKYSLKNNIVYGFLSRNNTKLKY